jgi:hypothetical protein
VQVDHPDHPDHHQSTVLQRLTQVGRLALKESNSHLVFIGINTSLHDMLVIQYLAHTADEVIT